MTVIGELLGIPAADRPQFQVLVRDWAMVLELLSPLAGSVKRTQVRFDSEARRSAKRSVGARSRPVTLR